MRRFMLLAAKVVFARTSMLRLLARVSASIHFVKPMGSQRLRSGTTDAAKLG